MSAYSFDEFKKILGTEDGLYIAKSSATDRVLEVYPDKTRSEAEEFIKVGLGHLKQEDYCNTLILKDCRKSDVYGLIYDKRHWYIKFLLEYDNEYDEWFIANISFHPPRWDMKTISGTVIKREKS